MARSVELDKGSRFVVLASVCVVVGALYFAREVLVPLSLAVLLTFLLSPVVRRVERLRLGRVASVLIVVAVALGLVGALGWVVEKQFVQIANDLPKNTARIKRKIDNLRGSGGGLGKAMENIKAVGEAVAPGATTHPATAPTSAPSTAPSTVPTTAPTSAPATGPTTRPATMPATVVGIPGAAAATGGVAPDVPAVLPPAVVPLATVPAAVVPSSVAPSGSPQVSIPVVPVGHSTADPRPSDRPASHEPSPSLPLISSIEPPNAAPGAPLLKDVTPENPLPVRDFPTPPTPVTQVLQYLGIVLSPLATAGLVIVFVIFMLLGREDLRDRLIRLVGFGRLNLATEALDDAAARISRYLLSQAIINTCYGTCVAAGLWLLGKFLGHGQSFPSVLLWGLLAGMFRFVPYIGPFFGAAGPLVISFGFFETNGVFFGTLGMFVVVELAVSQVVEPLVYGSSTGMSTLAVLVSAVFWTWLWGPVGLLLSTPMTAVLVVVGKYVPQLRFLDVILGDEPVLEPPVRVYQRLLAEDQEEAAELSRGFLKERPLLEVYDDVLLPVLAMAEQDRHRGRLDEDRAVFVYGAMRGIVDELWDLNQQMSARPTADERAEKDDENGNGRSADARARNTGGGKDANRGRIGGNGGTTSDDVVVPRAGRPIAPLVPPDPIGAAAAELELRVPKGCTVNIVCLPAQGEADEISGLMLAQLLEERGYCAFAVSQAALASEMVEEVASRSAHIVVVSALPPAAVSHSRYLCKRLHARHGDDLNMLVGLWTSQGNLEKAKDRITCAGTVRLVASYRRSLEELHQLAQPALLAERG